MSGYPLFFPEFVLCTNSSLFWFKIANELSEFRNYLCICEKILYEINNLLQIFLKNLFGFLPS